jgi:hypothetical protein
MHPYVKDLTGQTFGRLHVLCIAARPEGSKGRGAHWACICSCTNEIVVRSDSLVQGWATSCGCTNEKASKARAAIGPRRTKTPVSAQTAPDVHKVAPNEITSMSETTTPISNTRELDDLIEVRGRFCLMDLGLKHAGSREAVEILDRMITEERAKQRSSITSEKILANAAHMGLEPRTVTFVSRGPGPKTNLDCMNLNPKSMGIEPLTVKGETMGEQTERMRIAGACISGGMTTEQAIADAIALNTPIKEIRQSERKHGHYFKNCPYDAVDVYRVLSMFGVTDQALGHAIKKLLVAGGRGAGKDIKQDIQEAIDTLSRWQEMQQEDVNADLAILDAMTEQR